MTENAEKSEKAGGSASASKKINLEKSLDQLEGIVNALEAGELSLEQSLKKFEQGVALSKDCQLALDDAQQKIQELVEKSGGHELRDFDLRSD